MSGVASRSVWSGNTPWSLVTGVLGRVRRALDVDGLNDLDCEVRVSDVAPAARPRLLEPPHGINRKWHDQWEIEATQAIATSIGQAIAPQNSPDTKGTLGLCLAPAATSTNANINTTGTSVVGNGPVWALTCHHVVFPEESDHAPGGDRAREA